MSDDTEFLQRVVAQALTHEISDTAYLERIARTAVVPLESAFTALRDSLAEAERAKQLAYDTGYDAGRTSVEKWAAEQCDRAETAESRIDALEREKGEALAALQAIVGVLRRTGDSSTMRIVEIGRICQSFAALSDNRPEPEGDEACDLEPGCVLGKGHITDECLVARPTTGEPEG